MHLTANNRFPKNTPNRRTFGKHGDSITENLTT